MKIAAISDLHLDINRDYPVMEMLRDEVEESGASYLLVAGDVSEDFRLTGDKMRKLDESSSFSVLYVPGNHDLWSPEPDRFGIDYIYSFFKDDERCLSGKSVTLGGVQERRGWMEMSLSSGMSDGMIILSAIIAASQMRCLRR